MNKLPSNPQVLEKKALEKNYVTLIIADHGNCETMINPDGSPNTAHTKNPVPVILVDAKKRKINVLNLRCNRSSTAPSCMVLIPTLALLVASAVALAP